jgi:hypothetical protein
VIGHPPRREDPNEHIQSLCRSPWDYRRAVLFLDPFGIQVTLESIQEVAETRAIDKR